MASKRACGVEGPQTTDPLVHQLTPFAEQFMEVKTGRRRQTNLFDLGNLIGEILYNLDSQDNPHPAKK